MTSTTTTKTPTTEHEELEDCPICLETFTVSEQLVYPLPCQNCDFNYCNRCVEGFVHSAADDFQVASDGSRQVKVSVSCPQCRSKYPLNIQDVLLLRQAHALGTSMIRNGCLLQDSDLTATQLSWKRDFTTQGIRNQLNDAHTVYVHCMKKSISQELNEDRVKKEADVWKLLLEKLPLQEEDDDDDDGDENEQQQGDDGEQKPIKRKSPKNGRKPTIDETLFQGMEEFMNKDEKIFLTELFTSGNVRSIAQAAMINHGILRMSMTGKHRAISKQNEPPMSKYETQKQIDLLEKTKISFPLPNHMPGYFLIPSYSKKDGYMTLAEEEWDGTITPPQRSKRVFDQIYGKYYKPPQTHYPQTVVTIQGVRGPIGRLGLRRGDVITHVNDVEWNGTARELKDYIYDSHANHPTEEISITVNANVEIATFLWIRHEMLLRSRGEI